MKPRPSAAGRGWRLRSNLDHRNKCLLTFQLVELPFHSIVLSKFLSHPSTRCSNQSRQEEMRGVVTVWLLHSPSWSVVKRTGAGVGAGETTFKLVQTGTIPCRSLEGSLWEVIDLVIILFSTSGFNDPLFQIDRCQLRQSHLMSWGVQSGIERPRCKSVWTLKDSLARSCCN